MANRGKKKRVSPALIVLITLLSLSVGTLAVVVVAYFTSEAAKVKGQPESYVGSGAIGELATEKVTLKINMENCTMTVDTKVEVTATI